MNKLTITEKNKLREIFRRIDPANFQPGSGCIVMSDKDFPFETMKTPEQIRESYKNWFESWVREDVDFLKQSLGI